MILQYVPEIRTRRYRASIPSVPSATARKRSNMTNIPPHSGGSLALQARHPNATVADATSPVVPPLVRTTLPRRASPGQGPLGRVLMVGEFDMRQDRAAAALMDAGYVIGALNDPAEVVAALAGFLADVVILDTAKGIHEDFAAIATIRKHYDVGILLVSDYEWAAQSPGAADFADGSLLRPVPAEMLACCVEDVLALRGQQSSRTVQLGDLVVDVTHGVAGRSGHRLELTPNEMQLLVFLAEQHGCVVSARQIANAVWGYDASDYGALQSAVSSLRRKLEAYGPRLLHTVHKLGYRLQPPL